MSVVCNVCSGGGLWYAPLAQAQYVETRAADCAARYAARANRTNAPPQQHHHAQGIALGN
jgi:hypothetical protein